MYGKLMNEALKSIIDNKNALFKALLIPTLVLVGIDIFLPSSFLSNGEKIDFEDNKFIFSSFIILSIILNIVMAVSVHRIILIKDDISSLEAIMPTQTLLKFFLKSVWIGLLTGLIFGILIAIFLLISIVTEQFTQNKFLVGIISYFLSALLTMIAFSRFSMVLPATAIDEKMSLLDALAFTKHYKLLSLFMVTIFPTIIAILIALVYGLIIGFLTGVVSSHLSILYVFLNVFITVLVISCLSVTYSYIKNEINEKSLKDKYIKQSIKECRIKNNFNLKKS
ncbi:hypothetical protein HOO31_05150 [Aliarcobacter cryaerophilus]|uniref:hypothetical protein n=1 Tax=Aliarcobacter cryaerophilus TaxID=28198 RepID=UPI00164C73B0|nr:hypothetical protein [Aliarcobacter cryaerophilus]QNK85996.1 hypothetical protein HOO31_05150 [Aliarcobacter cryaerophilus]